VLATTGFLGGRYRLIEPLGTGGMSVVWRCHDEVLDRPVAVKWLTPRFAADTYFRDRIRVEAKAVARLSHPHIVAVYDYGESIGQDGSPVPFVVMELVEGRSLADRLTGGPLPWRTAVEVAAEVAAALSAAHGRGMIHGDITPANVMLTPAGAKVVDFGVSAVVGERRGDVPIFGTPAFVAPERLAGADAGPAIDVYGLGVLLYLALTTELPQPEQPAPPTVAGLPPDVAVLCGQCLQPDPAARPSSAEVTRRLAAAAGIRVAPIDPTAPTAPAAPAAPAAEPARDAGQAEHLDPDNSSAAPPGADRAPTGTRIMPPSSWHKPETGVRLAPPWWQWRGRGMMIAAVAVIGVLAVIVTRPVGQPEGTAPSVSPTSNAAAPVITASPAPATAAVSVPTTTAIRCAVTVNEQIWNDGATLYVTVTNHGAADITGWALTFTLPSGQQIAHNWNGRWTQSGTQVTVRHVEYNVILPAGHELVVGANLTFHGKTASVAPTQFALNGAGCMV
jgi:serine/threonine-protein kinase